MGIPNHEATFGDTFPKYDWMETVYGIPTEQIPDNAPTSCGNTVCITTYKDPNLLHDLITGQSATRVLHFLNQTLINAFSK